MFDLTIHYDEETRQLMFEPEHCSPCKIYKNVSKEDIPKLLQEYLANLLANYDDVFA